jgi:hypothetical protein
MSTGITWGLSGSEKNQENIGRNDGPGTGQIWGASGATSQQKSWETSG